MDTILQALTQEIEKQVTFAVEQKFSEMKQKGRDYEVIRR